MTEGKNNIWKVSLCSFQPHLSKCILSSLLCYVGVAIVQGKTNETLGHDRTGPVLCTVLFCCIGAGYNRSKIRKSHKIQGSCLLDCLLYATPLYCCACVQELSETQLRIQQRKERQIVAPKFIQEPIIDIESVEISIKSNEIDEGASIEEFMDDPKFQYISFDEGKSKGSSIDQRIETSVKESSDTESIYASDHGVTFIEEYKEIAVEPLDGDNPLIYSNLVGTAPFSFLRGDPHNPNLPPPTYLSLAELKKPKATESKEIMAGLEPAKNGGLVCTDKEAIAKQKGIISEVFKQVISNMAKGLGAVSISLPVRIFEPRSTCERLIDRFSFAPYFLSEAARQKDPIARMKLTIAFAISGLYLGTRQEKPFNPLLGETFQGHFEDGTEIYVEHTAHNPPTDHFDLIGRGFRVFGYYELDGKLSLNELAGEFRGQTYVQFPGQIISFTQPKFVLGGTMYGDRTLNWVGELEFQDNVTGLSAAIRIGDDKKKWSLKKISMKKDDVIGKIWRYDVQQKKVGEAVCTVYGSWLKELVFVSGEKEEKLWQIDVQKPKRHIPIDRPLPSDWRYREDLIWLHRKNLEYAAGWKIRVETKQRDDRKLRGSKH